MKKCRLGSWKDTNAPGGSKSTETLLLGNVVGLVTEKFAIVSLSKNKYMRSLEGTLEEGGAVNSIKIVLVVTSIRNWIPAVRAPDFLCGKGSNVHRSTECFKVCAIRTLLADPSCCAVYHTRKNVSSSACTEVKTANMKAQTPTPNRWKPATTMVRIVPDRCFLQWRARFWNRPSRMLRTSSNLFWRTWALSCKNMRGNASLGGVKSFKYFKHKFDSKCPPNLSLTSLYQADTAHCGVTLWHHKFRWLANVHANGHSWLLLLSRFSLWDMSSTLCA